MMLPKNRRIRKEDARGPEQGLPVEHRRKNPKHSIREAERRKK